jgi:flagellar motor switch protein FliN/FliY
MPIHQLLRMGRGAVIELETHEDDQVQVLANNILIAKGDIVVVGDKIGIQFTEMLKGAATQP